MRLREITLGNVRRFTEPVRIGQIGDGINLLCAPNEAGKSTLFDAIHALFFLKHTATGKPARALRPPSGGGVTVAAVLQADADSFRIAKRWFHKPRAMVWKNGELIAQGGEAEDWLATLSGAQGGGPSALLWLRQGQTGVDHGRKPDAGEETARRDLLTSVTGAVGAITGGRRMEAALEQTRAELHVLATATGQPRKHGPWWTAQQKSGALEAERAVLGGQVAELASALERRRRLRATLAETDAPEAGQARAAALERARRDAGNADRHKTRLAQAEAESALARARAQAAAQMLSDRGRAELELGAAQLALQAARQAERAARDPEAQARDACRVARVRLDEANAAAASAGAVLRAVHEAAASRQASGLRAALETRIDRAEAARKAQQDAIAEAAAMPGADVLGRIAKLAEALRRANDRQAAAAPRLRLDYDPCAPALRIDGRALGDGEEVPLPGGGEIALPGIGRMRISVPGHDRADTQDAAAALASALDAAGCADPAAAKRLEVRRLEVTRAAELAGAQLEAIAPQGVQALRSERARLPAPVAAGTDLPEPGDAQVALRRAEKQVEAAGIDARSAERAQAAALRASDSAAAQLPEAEARAARAREIWARHEGQDAATVAQQAEDAAGQVSLMQARLEDLRAKAPDRDAAAAQVRRAEAAERQAHQERARLAEELAGLDVLIDTRAEAGVEERLGSVEGALAAAQESCAQIGFEVRVLERLSDALTAARADAHDRYFEPVARELRPLLGLLWPDASLRWDDATLLPDTLIRAGQEEPLISLSDGTQEQIAFLVRLAFARLLARDGRAAPVILDDALVYSDDERLAQMFAALHTAADMTQIVVLSCRQRAFRDLGATLLRFDPASEPDF